LLRPDALATLKRLLIPRALLVTPNLPEAAALVGARLPPTRRRCGAGPRPFLRLGCKAVLVKGGHGGRAAIGRYT